MIYSDFVHRFVSSAATVFMLVLAVGLMAQATSGNQPDERPEPDDTQADWIEATETQPEVDGDWIRLEQERPVVPAVGAQAISALRAEAFAIDLAAKARALATLEDLHAENELGPDDSLALDLIAFLATESYDFQVRRGGRVINDFPMIRAEAVRLLGSLGGAGATAVLSRVLRYEDDPYVLSQAVIAVAQAAPGPTPELLRTLTTLVNHMNALRRPDNALAIAIVYAVRDLHERSAGIDDPDLFRALISITQGGYSTAVRRAAVEVINTLRRQPSS